MSFRITGLDPKPFLSLYGLDDAALKARGVVRMQASDDTGYPERVELRNASCGESLLLLNYLHQPADTPYRSSHAIFVREGATVPYDACDEVPEPLRARTISLRGFDRKHYIADALVVNGEQLADAIERLFATESVSYLHAHYAGYGCYAARVDRA
ncbi:DUF1203 domain-containing protein [Luteibacter sp. NPDC031894]|uniref:DUF1203 domain-containing protein n=1 Tax=Luteibacter sp. NPDC031894 TaxID=3390572 RepID=UPI003CFFC91A